MACGTGKTLVSLGLAERLGAGCILVLCPSLSLTVPNVARMDRKRDDSVANTGGVLRRDSGRTRRGWWPPPVSLACR